MGENLVIGVDLGGTKTLGARIYPNGDVERHHEVATPIDSQEDLLAGLDALVEELLDDDVKAIGFGIPSRIDQRTGRAVASVNIPLADLDFRDRMSGASASRSGSTTTRTPPRSPSGRSAPPRARTTS